MMQNNTPYISSEIMSAIANHDADSDDDDDEYVPPGEADSSSSEDEPDAKRPRTDVTSPASQEIAVDEQEARHALWSSFQASLKEEPTRLETIKVVKIEKRYKYAGQEVVEVVEVPTDSPDAKKWPLWREPQETKAPLDVLPESSAPPKSLTKRPGPRKSKVSFPSQPTSQKAKKLSTLDKSAIDWRAHIQGSESSLKDELEANRRNGGYIEKMEFLNRVEERKADVIEASKSSKRRRP